MNETIAIRTSNLTHRYGSRVALDRFDLEVRRGERMALLGPNGGGKTTLFRILSTLMTPTDGSAAVDGFDVVAERNAVRRRIGVVFQSPSLDAKLTVRENLHYGGRLYGLGGRELRDRIDELLGRFGVLDRARDRVDTLSGGLARRAELAKSLLHRPDILLLDEPTTGLDVTARLELWKLIDELHADGAVTVLTTTHVLEDADTADRVAIVDRGRRVALDTPAALKQQVGGTCVTLAAADNEGVAAEVRDKFHVDAHVVNGAVRVEHTDGYRFASEAAAALGDRVKSMTISQPTLADAFIHLTGRRLADENGGSHA